MTDRQVKVKCRMFILQVFILQEKNYISLIFFVTFDFHDRHTIEIGFQE